MNPRALGSSPLGRPCRVALIGCVDSTEVALRTLLALPGETHRLTGLVTRRASSVNADFTDLSPLAQAHRVPVLYAEDAADDEQQAAWLRQREPDLLFCIGWSRLLGPQTLAAAPLGTVGFHPAALPANRGRHPLIWALALGLEETASSFFLVDEGADSGPILSQVRVPITPQDDAGTLYAKVLAVMPAQITEIALGLAQGRDMARPQDPRLASSWRKRSAADGCIDWRMSARNIHNLVRALARPYPGAEFKALGTQVKLWRSAVQPAPDRRTEPGKVLAVQGRHITVQCGDDALVLLEHELAQLPAPGDYF